MMLFTFFVFEWKLPFLGKFVPKNQNYQFKLKFGTYSNSDMQNSMVMFTFSVLIRNTLFGQISSKKSNLSVEVEIWYLDQFKYAELNGDVHFFCF